MDREETAGSLERAPRARTGGSKEKAKPQPEPAQVPLADEVQRQRDALTLVRRLAGKPAAEVLARIADGDMLRLYPLCAERLRETFFVLDPERVFERALAEVAVTIELEGAGCAEPAGLLAAVDRAIQSVLERDRREEHDGIPPADPDKHFAVFIDCCFIEPPMARLSSVRFNALDPRVRHGFLRLLVEARPLEEVLAMGLGPPERLQLDILHALKAIGLLDDAGVEELRIKGPQP
jgi:hypothetical protein